MKKFFKNFINFYIEPEAHITIITGVACLLFGILGIAFNIPVLHIVLECLAVAGLLLVPTIIVVTDPIVGKESKWW